MLAEAAAGRPSVVIVEGEAGIGKSRLLAELGRQASERSHWVLVGGCLDMAGGGVPFLPLAEALRGLSRSTPPERLEAHLGPARFELAALLPELWPAEASPRSDPIPAAATTGAGPAARMFGVVLSLMGRLGAEAPVLAVFEDVHWIDRASRDLVTFLCRNLTHERVLLVLSVRTDDLTPADPTAAWLAELERQPRVHRIGLDRLDRAGVAHQIEAILGSRPSPGLVERIASRSDGNPFFVEELLAAENAGGAAPRTLEAILAARLAGLSPSSAEAVAALAVAGRPAEETLLRTVLDRPETEVRAALREAIDRQVLELDRSRGAYRFRHALLADVARTGLLPGERRSLHERYAETLASRPELADASPAGAAAELAHHWDAADRVDEAYRASLDAAAATESVAAHAQALRHYERALELFDRASPGVATDRLGLLRRAADAADLASEIPRAMELVAAALAMVDEAADPTLCGLLHGRLGYLTWASGDGPGGLHHHLEAARLVPADPPSVERARVLGGLGGALMGVGRYAESREICESAVACAVATGARSEEARARNMLGSDLVALGDVAEGLEQLERSRRIAAEAGPPEMLIVTHHNYALNLAQAGRLEDALAEADAGREQARRAGLERRYGPDLAALATDVLIRLGRWDDAAAVATEGLDLDPAGLGTVYLSAVRGRLHALRGEWEEATERFEIADRLAAGDVDPHLAAFVARGRAELLLGAGDPGGALTAVQKGLSGLGSTPDAYAAVPLLMLGLQAAADLGELCRASRDADGLARATDAGGALSASVLDLDARRADPVLGPLIDLALAEGERLEGRAEPARWMAAAERLDELPDPYLAAYARFRGAEAELRSRGVRGGRAEHLAAAHAAATRVGAGPLRRSIEELALRARVALAPMPAEPAPDGGSAESGAPVPATPGVAGLSAREVEVLRLVALGQSNGEIAERLFITRKTAAVHVTHILDKLGVANRVEAAMVAARLGLAAPADGEDRGS